MTVYDVLGRVEASQWVKIVDKAGGNACGTALLLYKTLAGEIMKMLVDMICAEGGVIVVEVKSE